MCEFLLRKLPFNRKIILLAYRYKLIFLGKFLQKKKRIVLIKLTEQRFSPVQKIKAIEFIIFKLLNENFSVFTLVVYLNRFKSL